MRIEFDRQGGFGAFPGRRVGGAFDTDALAPPDGRRHADLVSGARFFALPARVGDPHGTAADARTYRIAVHDGDRSHRVQVSEPVVDQALADLIDELQRLGRDRPRDR
jgi:hypothetical protein